MQQRHAPDVGLSCCSESGVHGNWRLKISCLRLGTSMLSENTGNDSQLWKRAYAMKTSWFRARTLSSTLPDARCSISLFRASWLSIQILFRESYDACALVGRKGEGGQGGR